MAPAMEVDHIVPRDKGGGHEPDNLQSLCSPCHALKTANENRIGHDKGSCAHGTPVSNPCYMCEVG